MTSPSPQRVRRFIKYFLAAADLFFSGDGYPQAARRRLARNADHSRRAVTQAGRHVIPGAALAIAKADGTATGWRNPARPSGSPR